MKKKKNYVYFAVPLLGLIIFAALYWNFDSQYEAKQAQIAATAAKAKKESA